jgi:large subunit ribosomal protein L15
MKNLSNLRPNASSNVSPKRLGRGIGSGLGKTAGKGHKGQRARKSGNVRPGFEGGQTPLYRRLPKFGFSNNHRKVEYTVIKLSQLNLVPAGEIADVQTLVRCGLVRDADLPIKILAGGQLKRKITVKVEKVSAGARQAIQEAGGDVEEI